MASATSRPTIQGLSDCSFTYIRLNERGGLFEGTKRVTVHYCYQTIRNPINAFDALVLRVREAFQRICPLSYVTVLDQAEATLSENDYETNYQAFIDQLRERHPREFELTETHIQENFSEAPSYPPELFTRIEEVLERQGMRCPAENLSCLLTAREQALKVHRGMPTHTIAVSSKSPYFRAINDPIRLYNSEKKERRIRGELTNDPDKCTASVRVIPNKGTCMTVMGLAKMQGGNKTVTCEIYIDSEGEVRLMRRNKQRDDRRTPTAIGLYQNSIRLITPIRHPHILSPEIVYSTPKGIQFLSESYPSDAFIYIEPYYHFARGDLSEGDDMARPIVSTPIETQVSQTIKYMMDVTKGLKALLISGILYNDTKPENILVDQDKAILFDFDAARTLSEGRYITGVLGTPDYNPTHNRRKDVSTELYALALTFWMNSETRKQEHVSFMDVFISLRTLTQRRGNAVLEGKIDALIKSLSTLCKRMKSGVTAERGPTLGYEDVLSTLTYMADRFNPSKRSASDIV